MQALKQRNVYIDMTRGLAIILVVLGHALQYTLQDYDENIIFRAIYSFHMPLFMFISGFVNYGGKKDFSWIKRRMQALLVPFLIWIFIPFILEQNFNMQDIYVRIIEIVKSPDNSNWFIYILFMNCCVLYLEENIKIKLKIERDYLLFLGGYFVLFILAYLFKGWFGFGGLFDNYIFFIAGYLFAEYKEIIPYQKWYGKMIGCLVFILVIPFWRRVENPVYIEFLIDCGAASIVQLAVKYVFRYLVAFGGITISFLLTSFIKAEKIKKLLVFLGRNTLEIYLLHRYWFGLVKISNQVVMIIAQCVIGIVISVLIAYLIESKWLSKLLFGKE